MSAPPMRFVGIDVGEAHLDIALLLPDRTFRVPNDEAGWSALIARIGDPPVTIVLEATGPYHVGVTLALAAVGMPPAVMNPEQTHAFIRSEGQRTKTDRTDAKLLARFAQQKQPQPSPVLTQNARDLKELVACRDDFTKLLTMERNRLHVATDRTRAHHQAVIDHLTGERLAVEREIAAVIAADPDLATRNRVLRSMPGSARCWRRSCWRAWPSWGSPIRKGWRRWPGSPPHPAERDEQGARPPPGRPPDDSQGALSDGAHGGRPQPDHHGPFRPASAAIGVQTGGDRLCAVDAGNPQRHDPGGHHLAANHGRSRPILA